MRRLVDTHIPRFRQTWQERTLRAPPSPHACTGVRTVCALTRSPKCARPRIRASHSSSVSAHGCSACNLRCPAGNRQRNRLPEASREVRRLAANLQQASVHFISALFTTFAALHCHTTLQCYAHHFVHVGSAVCIISLAVWLCGDYVRARSLCAHQECSAPQVPNVCERAGRPAHIVLQSWPCSRAHARASHNCAPFDPVQRDTATAQRRRG